MFGNFNANSNQNKLTFGGFGQNKSTFGSGFGTTTTQQQPGPLSLTDIGAELIDASIQYNDLYQQQQRQFPKPPLNQFNVSQPYTQSGLYDAKSGFGSDSAQKTSQQNMSNASVLKRSYISRQQRTKTSQLDQTEEPKSSVPGEAQQIQPSTPAKRLISYQNQFGSVEFEDLLDVPEGFQAGDYIEIRSGFIGFKAQCERLSGKKALIKLFNVYPKEGEKALLSQAEVMGAEHLKYENGTWEFRWIIV